MAPAKRTMKLMMSRQVPVWRQARLDTKTERHWPHDRRHCVFTFKVRDSCLLLEASSSPDPFSKSQSLWRQSSVIISSSVVLKKSMREAGGIRHHLREDCFSCSGRWRFGRGFLLFHWLTAAVTICFILGWQAPQLWPCRDYSGQYRRRRDCSVSSAHPIDRRIIPAPLLCLSHNRRRCPQKIRHLLIRQ